MADQLFTSEMLKAATMSELAAARARRGFCPGCQAQSLRHCFRLDGIVFRKCAECDTVAMMSEGGGNG
jgi:Zn ribbon nucleic-acid-binding protein